MVRAVLPFTMTEQTNIITLDFRLPKPSKRVKRVQSIAASAAANGAKLLWVGRPFEDKWEKWGRAHAGC